MEALFDKNKLGFMYVKKKLNKKYFEHYGFACS